LRSKPAWDTNCFPTVASGNFWSSTTLIQAPARAWDLNVDYGIVSYSDKTVKQNVILVRGGMDKDDLAFAEAFLPGGEYEMGDHHGFVDPSHPSDELPLHMVRVDAFYMGKTEVTNRQFLAFLNAALLDKSIEVRNNTVYAAGGTDIYCYTHEAASYYSISYDGKIFTMADFRTDHPMVGVMWYGAAAFCNWLSVQAGLDPCYTLSTWVCDFAKNGFRLPTEAEWEYAGRGGQTNPYYNYPWGNDQDISKANWPESKDPYEGTDPATYPWTTPAGFYDGSLKLKSAYNWPGTALSYQTADGANPFGLYDMAGNVWELVNDWYGQKYYSLSPYDNPKGPDSGFIMPDGKAYRGMRGGNWYNGYKTTGVNDGHSRVSNRNPSYYRGPQDPNHPWYHVGFRVVRNGSSTSTKVQQEAATLPETFTLSQNYPNPFNPATTITFTLAKPEYVSLKVFNTLGQEMATLVAQEMDAGIHRVAFNAGNETSGVLFCALAMHGYQKTIKMMLLK